MTIEVDSLPYATIVLHALKYPSKAVYGLLLGEAKGSKVKVRYEDGIRYRVIDIR